MRYRTTQIILIFGATALLGVFLVLWYQTARTDAVLAWAEDLPAHTRVERGHLRVVKVGVDHDFPVLDDPGRVVGYYTTRPITGRGLVAPTDVSQSLPPQRHVFPNGQMLPQGTDGYGFPLVRQAHDAVSQPLAASLLPGDLVDVYLVVPGEELMYLLLQEFPILYRLEDPPVAALALTPEQVAVVEGMMAKAGSGEVESGEVEPPYYLVLPTQGDNPDREPLAAFPFEPADPSVLAPVE
jgi:hypothetical protein